jgi:hypothetical protein
MTLREWFRLRLDQSVNRLDGWFAPDLGHNEPPGESVFEETVGRASWALVRSFLAGKGTGAKDE